MENRSRAVVGTEMIYINVKTRDSRVHRLRVITGILICHLKEEIVRATGIPRQNLRLLYAGKALQDEDRLSDHIVENDHMLLAVHVPHQPNVASSSSHNLSPADLPTDFNITQNGPAYDIHFHGHGSRDVANQVLSHLMSGLIMNFRTPQITPENPDMMRVLISDLVQLRRLASQENGGAVQFSMIPSSRPLYHMLNAVISVLTALLISIFTTRAFIETLSRRPDLFAQSFEDNATILRDQLQNSAPFLTQLGHLMSNILESPAPTMPPPPPPPPATEAAAAAAAAAAVSVPSQPGRRRSTRLSNNGASSSNSNNNAVGNRRAPASPRPRNPWPSSRRRRNDD